MSHPPRLLPGLCLAALAICASASPALAQYYGAPRGSGYYPPPPPPMRVYRQGITVGAGVGLGFMSADNCGASCGSGPAFEFHIGGMVTPQLALMLDAFPVLHEINADVEAINTQYTFAAQFFPVDQFWLKGGVGFAHYTETAQNGFGLSDSGTAFLLAAGFEVYQSGPFALDLQLRLGRSLYNTAKDHGTGALMVGFNWY
jgi:hypothetical protein